MSLVLVKADFRICENKDAGHRVSPSLCPSESPSLFDLSEYLSLSVSLSLSLSLVLCFRYIDSTILFSSLIRNFKSLAIFSVCPARVCAGPGRKPRRPVFFKRGSNNLQMAQKSKTDKNIPVFFIQINALYHNILPYL